MANTFRPREEVVVKAEPQPERKPHHKPRPQPKPRPAKRPVQIKGIGKVIKFIRKGFENVFGGGFLQRLNLRRNWKFILMIVVMVIVLIYSNLQVQSKRDEIIKLNREMIVAKDEAMDAIEEGYNIDKQKEREVLQEGEERGFHNSGYIPYIISE